MPQSEILQQRRQNLCFNYLATASTTGATTRQGTHNGPTPTCPVHRSHDNGTVDWASDKDAR